MWCKSLFQFEMMMILMVSFVLFLSPVWGRYCFHRCVSVHREGGTPVPGSFPGLWSQVLSRGYPSPRFFPIFLVPGGLGTYPSPGCGTLVLAREVPQSQLGASYDWVTPQARTGLGYLTLPLPGGVGSSWCDV